MHTNRGSRQYLLGQVHYSHIQKLEMVILPWAKNDTVVNKMAVNLVLNRMETAYITFGEL